MLDRLKGKVNLSSLLFVRRAAPSDAEEYICVKCVMAPFSLPPSVRKRHEKKGSRRRIPQ